jgi:hypothetical protein
MSTASPSRYWFTDRNNAAVDMFDVTTETFTQVKGMTGCQPAGHTNCVGSTSNISGPNGINFVPAQGAFNASIYAPDVQSVKVIDESLSPPTVVNNITNVGLIGSGHRADEGCYDQDDHIYMIASPDDQVYTFINTMTQTIIGRINMVDSVGMEQCRYDHQTGYFFFDNDGTVAATNPNGEVDAIQASFITPGNIGAGVNFPAGGNGTTMKVITSLGTSTIGATVLASAGPCTPAGTALGPGNDFAVSCRPSQGGMPLYLKIFDKTNGQLLALVPMGGADQIEYDATSNRYYTGGGRWTATGITGATGSACTAAAPCTPVLGIVNAATRTVVATVNAGNAVKSLGIDPVTGKVFMAFTSPNATATTDAIFAANGMAIYLTR